MNNPVRLFLLGSLLLVAFGAGMQAFAGGSSLDVHLHDTYFVIAHVYVILLVAFLFCCCAGVYFIFPKLLGRRLNRRAGIIHFWVTLAGVVAIFWPAHYEGVSGMPRRYYDYSAHNAFMDFLGNNIRIAIVVVLVLAAQALFLVNLLVSAIVGKRCL